MSVEGARERGRKAADIEQTIGEEPRQQTIAEVLKFAEDQRWGVILALIICVSLWGFQIHEDLQVLNKNLGRLLEEIHMGDGE